jgi:hypothetical protein
VNVIQSPSFLGELLHFYRSSKLTHLLKNALGGNSKTTFIANLWDDVEQQQETVSTCRFAQRMAQLQTSVAINVVTLDQSAIIEQYAKQTQDLRAEVAELQRATATPSVVAKMESDKVQEKVQRLVQLVMIMYREDSENKVGPSLYRCTNSCKQG